MFPVVAVIGFFCGNMQMDNSPWTQTWIAKLVAKCLRMDPCIALLVSENLETTEARRG